LKLKRPIKLGVLYSRSGDYATLSRASRAGVMAAIAAVNADPALDVLFEPVERDPGGNTDAYGPLCHDILQNGARHVVGCVTSWSRKEVIPVLERMGGTLWYPLPYEGFEASDHVVYTHACPNQHLLPLMDWVLPVHGPRGFLTGSNYIWGWEMNRLARDCIHTARGEVLGERYLPLGARDVGRIVHEIAQTRPDFILNNLVGTSSYDFLSAMHELARQDRSMAPDRCPILSCNLTEAELAALGPAAEGLISAGPYFRPATGGEFASSIEAAAFFAVRELARRLHGRPGAETATLAALLDGDAGGSISRETHHSALPVQIARVQGGVFHVIKTLPTLAGDPYLTQPRAIAAPRLRVVS
jgi:ABC-type branched-subunit amino acid transport system substrate-binding protein